VGDKSLIYFSLFLEDNIAPVAQPIIPPTNTTGSVTGALTALAIATAALPPIVAHVPATATTFSKFELFLLIINIFYVYTFRFIAVTLHSIK
jgi:hypothetical protein